MSSLPSLKDKIYIVTGGNTGIGYATCLNLVAHDARVYMGSRSSEKAETAIAEIRKSHPNADLHFLQIDNQSLSSVVEAAKRFSTKETKLHGLILNAGIMAVPYEVTTDGYEVQFQVNYIAHWLLTYHLIPILLSTARSSPPGSVRIACVSSEGHNSFGVKKVLYNPTEVEKFGDFGRYGLSKLANVLHAKSLNDQYGPGSQSAKAGEGEILTASFHPGFIDTQLNIKNRDRASWKLSWIHPVLQMFGIMRPWDEGCITSLFVAASPEFTSEMSGLYFNEKATVKEPNPVAKEVDERTTLEEWTTTEMKSGGWI